MPENIKLAIVIISITLALTLSLSLSPRHTLLLNRTHTPHLSVLTTVGVSLSRNDNDGQEYCEILPIKSEHLRPLWSRRQTKAFVGSNESVDRFSTIVISVYPHFSSINDAANPMGSPPMMTADFTLAPDVVAEVVEDDMLREQLPDSNVAIIDAVSTLKCIVWH